MHICRMHHASRGGTRGRRQAVRPPFSRTAARASSQFASFGRRRLYVGFNSAAAATLHLRRGSDRLGHLPATRSILSLRGLGALRRAIRTTGGLDGRTLMKCPACDRALTAVKVVGVTVDLCRDGCGGIWFDQGKLSAFAAPEAAAGQALLDLTAQPPFGVKVTQRRHCPKCPDSVMMRHFFSAKRAVTIDECPTCGGIWLDSGELERIRTEYDSDEARQRAARLGLEEALLPDRMALMRKQLEEQLPYSTGRSRVAASLVVIFNLVLAFKGGGARAAAAWLFGFVVPWACVSFPDAMSAPVGSVLGVSRRSPQSWLWFFGWLVLLLPEIQLAIVWMGLGSPQR